MNQVDEAMNVSENFLSEKRNLIKEYLKEAAVYTTRQTLYLLKIGKVALEMKEFVPKKKWTHWYKKNAIPGISLRSMQDFMGLARIKKIEQYAFFGTERLKEINRIMSKEDKEKEDPIKEKLQQLGLNFNSDMEANFGEYRTKVDAAIVKGKLSNKGITNIENDRIEALLKSGIEITNKHISALLEMDRSNNNVVKSFIEELIQNNGKFEPSDGMKAASVTKSILKFENILERLNKDQLNGIKNKIEACIEAF